MREPMMEPVEPYEAYADNGDDWDEDEEGWVDREPLNVLWGRVALLGFVVVIAFLFGRALGTGGIPESELVKAQDQISTLTETNDLLKAELAAVPEVAIPPEKEAGPGDNETTPDPGTDAAATIDLTGKTYKVRSGDTLRAIANRFYGDGALAGFLAEVNELKDPGLLSIGQKLLIPNNTPQSN